MDSNSANLQNCGQAIILGKTCTVQSPNQCKHDNIYIYVIVYFKNLICCHGNGSHLNAHIVFLLISILYINFFTVCKILYIVDKYIKREYFI